MIIFVTSRTEAYEKELLPGIYLAPNVAFLIVTVMTFDLEETPKT